MPKQLSIFLLTVITCVLVIFAQPLPKQDVKVWVFDVGQGDAIFIDAPHKQMLIDGGPDDLVLERLSSVMPWWDRSIDIVVDTHPHADHFMGLIPVLERYRVSQVLDADQGYASPEFAAYLAAAGTRREILAGDVTVDLGDGVHLKTLWPPAPYQDAFLDDPNDGSIIFLLEYGQTSMLLTGDAGVEQEHSILQQISSLMMERPAGEHIDILKVGHHGSNTSTSQELLNLVKPDVAIISVGKDNDYGHPDSFVLDRLQTIGAAIYRTDQDGSLKLKMTPSDYSISTLRF